MADMENDLNLEAKKDLEVIFHDMIVEKVNELLKIEVKEIIERLNKNDKNSEENLKKIKNEVRNFNDELSNILEDNFDDNKKIVKKVASEIENIINEKCEKLDVKLEQSVQKLKDSIEEKEKNIENYLIESQNKLEKTKKRTFVLFGISLFFLILNICIGILDIFIK